MLFGCEARSAAVVATRICTQLYVVCECTLTTTTYFTYVLGSAPLASFALLHVAARVRRALHINVASPIRRG
jgi:hypothetical protein